MTLITGVTGQAVNTDKPSTAWDQASNFEQQKCSDHLGSEIEVEPDSK